MAHYTSFILPSGAKLYVESTQERPQETRGTVQASAAEDKAREAWSEGAKLVAEVGNGVVSALRDAFKGMDEVTIEFGASISGKTSIILAEGSASANLKVTVKWKAPPVA